MDSTLCCWSCGSDLERLPRPLSRRATCPACQAELHVCRMCRHYDTGKAKQCREPMAEPVMDKTRANFCEWFQAGRSHASPNTGSGKSSHDALNALFSDPPDETTPALSKDPRTALDDLFKP